jgi:recombination protein RecA
MAKKTQATAPPQEGEPVADGKALEVAKAARPEMDKAKVIKAELDFIKNLTGLKGIKPASQYDAITEAVSTGHEDIDKILVPIFYDKTGKGGFPCGHITLLYGPYAGGKSSLALMTSANVTKQGKPVLWFDLECSLVPEWAASHGVDNDLLIRIPPGEGGEKYLMALEKAAATGKYPLIVVDSLPGLVPQVALDTPLTENQRMACFAGMLTRSLLPKVVPAARVGNCAIVLINQIRQRPGVMYGNPETFPGGEALRHACGLFVRVSKVGSKAKRGIEGIDGAVIGIRSNLKTEKNRFGPSDQEAVLSILYTSEKPNPFDRLIDMALSYKLIKCKTRKDTGESVEYFSAMFEDGMKEVASIDQFKTELSKANLREMARKLASEKKVEWDDDMLQYVKGLEETPEGELL